MVKCTKAAGIHSKVPTIMSINEAKRAAYLIAISRGASKLQARVMAGLGPHAPQRIQRLYDQTGGLRDRPRSGRPSYYTPQLLQAAERVLHEDDSKLYTAATFTAMLIHRGILQEGANKRAFMRAWSRYLRKQGKQLTGSSTETSFLLTMDDAKERVKYAQDMLQLLKDGDVQRCIFLDESTLEENPHPKSGMHSFGWPDGGGI